MRAFGVRLALVPVSYASQITFDTVHLVEKRTPELFPLVGALVREAAQIGAFHLLGGVLASARGSSPSTGRPPTSPSARLEQLLGHHARARLGRFYATDFVAGPEPRPRAAPLDPRERLLRVRHGATVRSRLFFQQGMALAIMQLLHRVDFTAAAPIGRTATTRSSRAARASTWRRRAPPLRGDDICEVIVEALAD